MKKLFAVTLPFAVFTAPAFACDISQETYEKLEFDMNYAQVAEIFGCKSPEGVEHKITSGKAVSYVWKNEETGKSISTVFMKGELRSMAAPN